MWAIDSPANAASRFLIVMLPDGLDVLLMVDASAELKMDSRREQADREASGLIDPTDNID
jgi:hypothetical protein